MWWEVDFIGQAEKTSSVVGWRISSKALPKAKLAPKKKRTWSLFGDLLLVWPTTAFWIPANHYIWEDCSANQWDTPKSATPASSISQQKGLKCSPWQCLTAHCTTNASKEMNELGYEVLPHLPYSPDLLPSCQLTSTSSSILTSCMEDVSTTNRRQKILSRSSSNPKAWIFTLQE